MLWPVYLFVLVLAKSASTPPLIPPPPLHPAAASFGPSTPVSPPAPPVGSLPGQMTMFSVYVGAGGEDQEREVTLHCRLDRALSNLETRSLVAGTLGEDLIGAGGRILIPAGSKVVGQGFCDAKRARFLSRGRWTVFASDHQISAQGILIDPSHREGLTGTESMDRIDPVKVKEAIYRDGIFLYVPAGTEFLLRLWGDVAIQELGTAAERESR